MSDVADPIVESPAGTGGADSPGISEPQIDAARYQALEAYYNRTNPVLEQYKDDFNAIVEDEGYRDFQRKSRESYYDMQKRVAAEREAEIPESEKRLLSALDERLGKFKPVLDDYENRAKTAETTAKEAFTAFQKEQMQYADRLKADMGLTEDEIVDLSVVAKTMHDRTVASGQPRYISLEEAYKRTYGRGEAKALAAKPVPRSQRAVAGATGVPGASRTIEDRSDLAKPGGVTRHILGVLNNQRKTG